MEGLAVINEKTLKLEQLPGFYLDRGLYFGDGVYEVVRSYDGKLFALEQHLQRFERSLDQILIKNIDIDKIREKINNTFEKVQLPNAKIYFHVTRGSHIRDHMPQNDLEANFFMTITPLKAKNEHISTVSVCTHPDWRWKRCDIKSLNLLPNVLARIYAADNNCSEAILVDEKGFITEGAGSAFFAIDSASKSIITRPLGPEILPSITRDIILELAEKAKLNPVFEPMSAEDAEEADELFLAVTTRDIVSVTKFNGQRISSGICGEYTSRLKGLFQQVTGCK